MFKKITTILKKLLLNISLNNSTTIDPQTGNNLKNKIVKDILKK